MHRLRGAVLSALAAVTLTSCLMGPNYTRPEIETGEAWKLEAATVDSLANLRWWQLLQDEELQQLVRSALHANQDVRAAASAVREFQAQLLIARFALAPSLQYLGAGLLVHLQDSGLPVPVGGGPISAQAAFGMLQWEVDLWGRLRRSREAAEAQLLSREEHQRAVVIGLVSAVAEAYFDLRLLDLQADITRRTIRSFEDTVRISRARYEQGVLARFELERFEAERANAAARLTELEQLVGQKEHQLALLLGKKPGQIARGLALTDQLMPPVVPAGLPSDLLRRRPDILEAEQELAGATAAIGIAQAQRFPSFSLTGALGVASAQLSSVSIGPSFTQALLGLLTGPLLNANALGVQVEVARARAEQATLRYEKAVMTAFREVEDALLAVHKTTERLAIQEQQVASLETAFKLADVRYRGGRASYLDALTAQRTLFDAELAVTTTRRDHLVAVVQLYKALGGGWSPDDAPAKQTASAPRTGGERQP